MFGRQALLSPSASVAAREASGNRVGASAFPFLGDTHSARRGVVVGTGIVQRWVQNENLGR